MSSQPDYDYIEARILEEEMKLKEAASGLMTDKMKALQSQKPPSSLIKMPTGSIKKSESQNLLHTDGDLIGNFGVNALKRGRTLDREDPAMFEQIKTIQNAFLNNLQTIMDDKIKKYPINSNNKPLDRARTQLTKENYR